jgi:AraC family transcriptional regulator of adaptative response/methylated-DNA-[protein]-cysteine methyltransferase
MLTSTMTNPTAPQKSAVPSLFAGKAWQQVLERDPRADGQFVYAVKSTHIYCKPTCPSRRPDRKNVTFFPTPSAAMAAGYRACLRCEPDLATPRPDPQAAALAHVTEYLTQHANERTKLKDVALATGVPRLTILRGFKRVLGLTPTQFAKSQRLDRFKKELRPGTASPITRTKAFTPAPRPPKAPVTEAIYEAGFGSSSRLYENSSATLGMTPSALRRGAPALIIRYTVADSPLGRILVAATDLGICAIAFADDDATLRAELRTRFPKATLVQEPAATATKAPAATAPPISPPNSRQTGRSPDSLPDPSIEAPVSPASESPTRSTSTWLAEAVRYVLAQLTENPAAVTFPLDVRATAFQQRVWQALQAIPRGQTRTYSQLARDLDRPTATRAVAAACGANPLALVHPCHRVIGADGALTGYRWGVDRKRHLLANEANDATEIIQAAKAPPSRN